MSKESRSHHRILEFGIWKFELPNTDEDDSIEHQIPIWLDELTPKAEAFKRLIELGYEPYLSCRTTPRDCGVCIEPSVLARFADLNIALSIWFEDRIPI